MVAWGSRRAVRGWGSRCILKVEPVAFPDHLDVEYERKRRVAVPSFGPGDWKAGVVLSWAGKCSKGNLVGQLRGSGCPCVSRSPDLMPHQPGDVSSELREPLVWEWSAYQRCSKLMTLSHHQGSVSSRRK